MTMYMQAVQSGVSALELAFTGDNAQTRAAYNQAYQVAAQKAAIQEAKHAAELNVAAIEQDKVTSNTQIRMAQDQAEARAIVNAATAGVEGGSVEDVVYETEKNEAFAINSASRQSEQATESQLAIIGSQSSALLAVQEPEISYVGDLMQAFSSFEMSDLKTSEALSSEGYSLSALWSG